MRVAMMRFKFLLTSGMAALLLSALGTAIDLSAAASGADTKEAVGSQEGAPTLVTEFINAWNAHDGSALGRIFTPDGDFIGISGIQWRGPAEIAKVHSEQFAGRYDESIFTVDGMPSVALIKPDVALIHWRWTISGVRNPDGTPVAPYRGIFTWVAINHDGTWLVRAAQNNVSK